MVAVASRLSAVDHVTMVSMAMENFVQDGVASPATSGSGKSKAKRILD